MSLVLNKKQTFVDFNFGAKYVSFKKNTGRICTKSTTREKKKKNIVDQKRLQSSQLNFVRNAGSLLKYCQFSLFSFLFRHFFSLMLALYSYFVYLNCLMSFHIHLYLFMNMCFSFFLSRAIHFLRT